MKSFKDTIQEVIDGGWNKYTDILNEEENYWLSFLEQINLNKPPSIIKESRGIGAWNNPQIVIIVREIQTPKGFAREGTHGEYGHPWWNELGTYRRLRPFMESKKSLKFFYNLLNGCPKVSFENTYVTTYKKSWENNNTISENSFASEIKLLENTGKNKIVISLGFNEAFNIIELYNKNLNNRKVDWPTYYSKTHNYEWQQFKYQFCELICSALK